MRAKKSKISYQRKLLKLFNNLKLLVKIALVILLVLFFFTPIFKNEKAQIRSYFYSLTADYGLTLENVTIEGNKHLTLQEITDIIGAKKGAPILQLDLKPIQEKLEQHRWVSSAAVERQLPHDLYIILIEREPIAVWQIEKKLHLIDQYGEIIDRYQEDSDYVLPLVVGKEANIYAYNLLSNLKQCPEIEPQIRAAVRYGNRRWNLHFSSGMIAMMPEKDFPKAYEFLCNTAKEQSNFDQNYKFIDLRNSSKAYFERKQN